MDDFSPATLAALGSRFGVDLSENRFDDLAESVRAFVDTTTPIPAANGCRAQAVYNPRRQTFFIKQADC